MTRIKKLADNIMEEVEDAKEYAETYLDFKARNNQQMATKYKEMASDELRHAMILHDYTASEIENLRKVYTPPQDMIDKWEHKHKEYVEKVAWIKQMLAL